jgi:acyl transferase domain-containing protein
LAATVDAYWENLRSGRDCIVALSDAELAQDGIDDTTRAHERFVAKGGVLDDIELFDAGFFGISPREAEAMDPQQRLFLETVQHAFDDAGLDPERVVGRIGVYAGCRLSGYWLRLLNDRQFMSTTGWHQVGAGNDKDFLPAQTSFRFDLRGPSVNVQAACATSLLATALACDALTAGDCDVAVAGGASVAVPHRTGYVYQPSGIASSDGTCRPFDADADGSVLGNGVGAVVLKRLADAVCANDRIYAVILGTAVNNDGGSKSSFAAPSVQGQSAVITAALARAAVTGDSLDYVEAHGTATALGDPIEAAALARAIGRRSRPLGIGSVKGNIGHLDPAAGVASLIKVALALDRKELPPSIHFKRPNPEIDFANAGLRVIDQLESWPRGERPRRAGVSSFGIGGTNVHAVLEEAPPRPARAASLSRHLLLLSAKSANALDEMAESLATHLATRPELPLADIAYTLAYGRRRFPHRRVVVAASTAEAVAALRSSRADASPSLGRQEVFFLFPGQGTQGLRAGQELYRSLPSFREDVSEVAALAEPHLGFDLRALVEPEKYSCGRDLDLQQTELAQPGLFAIGYATARLWMACGLHPQGLLGHSIGELVAACIAEIMTLTDAVRLVCARGRLMQAMPPGTMLVVHADAGATEALLGDNVVIAAFNAPRLQTLAGSTAAIAEVESRCREAGIGCRRLSTSHAFHHPTMRPAAAEFATLMHHVPLRPPQRPILSNLTGTWLTEAQATDPEYWAATMVAPVRFAPALDLLLQRPAPVLIECGPGATVSAMIAEYPAAQGRIVVKTMAQPSDGSADLAAFLTSVGRLWAAGVDIHAAPVWAASGGGKTSLPGYPFRRKRYWIDAPAPQPPPAAPSTEGVPPSPAFAPEWHPAPAPTAAVAPDQSRTWLVLADSGALGQTMCGELATAGHRVAAILAGARFERIDEAAWILDPTDADQVARMLDEAGIEPGLLNILNLWPAALPSVAPHPTGISVGALLALTGPTAVLQAASRTGRKPASFCAVTANAFCIIGNEPMNPLGALAIGPARVLPQEVAGLAARLVDLTSPSSSGEVVALARLLLAEVVSEPDAPIVAYRQGQRLVPTFVPVPLPPAEAGARRLRSGGTYLITGGFGGMGGVLARTVASTCRGHVVLVGRRGLGASETGAELVRAIEASGATVAALAADIADHGQVAGLIAAVEQRFGRIDGVVHAAGVKGEGMLLARDAAAAASVLAPKVAGTLALMTALARHRPDFILLCSSFAAQVGGLGQGDYASANAFLDAAAWFGRAVGLRVTSVGWPAWREVGMAAAMVLPSELQHLHRDSLAGGLSNAEGAELFLRLLALDVPQVVLPPRMPVAGTEPVAVASQRPVVPAATATPPSAMPDAKLVLRLQERLAVIWKDVLGHETIATSDDFFALGGQSLMGLQVVARVQELFPIELDLSDLFAQPTLARLAELIHHRLIRAVDAMPDAEVERQLKKGQVRDLA